MRQSVTDRFWSRIDKGDEEWHCWEWVGAIGSHGYGSMSVSGKQCTAHRLSYRLHLLWPPEPEVVMHVCDNKRCVNPLHLIGGTHKLNQRDCRRKGRGNPVVGVRHPNAKFTNEQIADIRLDARPHRTIAAEYGVDHRTIGSIQRGETWRHL